MHVTEAEKECGTTCIAEMPILKCYEGHLVSSNLLRHPFMFGAVVYLNGK